MYISEIIEDDLSNELAPSQREFLIKLFNNIKNVISQYSWDVGRIRDYTGQPINMKIPLKRPLPRLSKAYKLSEDEENSLNDILNFLIYFGLAENVDSNNQQGSPVFLVQRPETQKASRLIFDTRIVNEYIDAPVSTHSQSVIEPISEILAKADIVSMTDLRNAYYALRLDSETLASNISNI